MYFDVAGSLRNKEQDKDVFILGNGPSVLNEDLTKLTDKLVIGMNGSTSLQSRFGFIQDYYVVSDRRFLTHPVKRRWATSDLDASTIRVLRADLEADDDPAFADRTTYTPHIKRDGFSADLSAGFFYGCTTTMLAIQLAAFMGCRRVFLMGVDLRYSAESPRCYTEANPQIEDSFTSVQIWNIANASKVMAQAGCQLVNCSEHSLLRPHLPFRQFDDVVSSATVPA
ncbi:MAG: 6-hydroxymethylpterin diphosphokinase MptE-like protein [Burkholderiaceae bacterium]